MMYFKIIPITDKEHYLEYVSEFALFKSSIKTRLYNDTFKDFYIFKRGKNIYLARPVFEGRNSFIPITHLFITKKKVIIWVHYYLSLLFFILFFSLITTVAFGPFDGISTAVALLVILSISIRYYYRKKISKFWEYSEKYSKLFDLPDIN